MAFDDALYLGTPYGAALWSLTPF